MEDSANIFYMIVAMADFVQYVDSCSQIIKKHYPSAITKPMTTKHGKMETYYESLPPIKSRDLWSRGLARSGDKLKPLYFLYHNVYGRQTWQGGNLYSGASRSCNLARFRDKSKN